MDRNRSHARGGRRLLLDRAERDRARARRLRAAGRPGRRRRRARVRPAARGVPLRAALVSRVGLEEVEAVERGTHTDQLGPLWEEMTMVRRSAPTGAQW